MKPIIKLKDREAIIKSLRAGVVPKVGLQHVQVGRHHELKSFIRDIDNIKEGGSSFRMVIGEYGSGKTFFLSMVRSVALEKGLVTISADLAPDKRFYGTHNEPGKLLSDLIANISTRTKPDGNALVNIIERFISTARELSTQNNISVSEAIYKLLNELNDYPGGYSFASVIDSYWRAYNNGDSYLKDCALRWLRGEYHSKVDIYKDLGIRENVNDTSIFNTLILFSVFVRKAGYSGLLICLDELVNLYKIINKPSRMANYEVILNILNSTLQGTNSGIGFIMCGTPEFLADGHKGLYSYDALRTRLTENTFSGKMDMIDYDATVLRMANLTQEELYILLKNLRNVFASGVEENYLLPDEALITYMNYCQNIIGSSYFRTPRNTIKGFLDLLSLLDQYPEAKWEDMIGKIHIEKDIEATGMETVVGLQGQSDSSLYDEFATFKL